LLLTLLSNQRTNRKREKLAAGHCPAAFFVYRGELIQTNSTTIAVDKMTKPL